VACMGGKYEGTKERPRSKDPTARRAGFFISLALDISMPRLHITHDHLLFDCPKGVVFLPC